MLTVPLLQACLNAPDPATGDQNGVDPENDADSPEDNPQMPAPQANMPRGAAPGGGMPAHYITPEQQQQMAYHQYMQQQQQGVGGSYPMPPQSSLTQDTKF